MMKLYDRYLFENVFHYYNDKSDMFCDCEQLLPPRERGDVDSMLSAFRSPERGGRYDIDPHYFKGVLIDIFKQPNDFWQPYLQRPFEQGYHRACCEFWWGTFPDDEPLDHFDQPALYYTGRRFHLVMMKFLVKSLMWDVLYPNEPLPNYCPPINGQLPIDQG